jgi:hypothetical protein
MLYSDKDQLAYSAIYIHNKSQLSTVNIPDVLNLIRKNK